MRNRLDNVMIVDGYNVIRADARYSSLIDEDPQITDVYMRAREALIADVAAAAQRTYDATIVFDGGGNPYSDGKDYQVAGVRVMFSPHRKEADELIEKLATSAREAGREVLVVTSDAATQWTVFGDGVTRQSSRMFVDEVSTMNMHLEEDARVYQKATVQDRLSPEVREKLRRLARGESL